MLSLEELATCKIASMTTDLLIFLTIPAVFFSQLLSLPADRYSTDLIMVLTPHLIRGVTNTERGKANSNNHYRPTEGFHRALLKNLSLDCKTFIFLTVFISHQLFTISFKLVSNLYDYQY